MDDAPLAGATIVAALDLDFSQAATLRVHGGKGGDGVQSRAWVALAVRHDEVRAVHAGFVSAHLGRRIGCCGNRRVDRFRRVIGFR